MQPFGLICAMEEELAPFLPQLTRHAPGAAGLTFREGELCGLPVTAVVCDGGTVNAAIGAQALLDRCAPSAVLNVGAGGGMDAQVQLFDTVVATETTYHDLALHLLIDGRPFLPDGWFPADPALLAAARRAAGSLAHPVRFGRVVTGDVFIADEGREAIERAYRPLSVDMETAAIAHACYVGGVPFLAVRTITDTAQHSGVGVYEQNNARACAIAAEVACAILREHSQKNG